MISKIISGKSFKRLCEYLCKDQGRAMVIGSDGVRDYNYELMATDFERQRGMNRNVKSPVLHMILSYYPGEQVSDETMAKIATEYLGLHGIKNTQYAIIKHSDRNHPHTHIIVNRIDNDGRTIKDGWIGYKGKKIAQHLTLKYGLIQAEKKTPELTQLERRNEYESIRFKIYQTIHEILPKCKDPDELKFRLEKQNIQMLFKYKGSTTEIQGVSFQVGNFKYKGSEIDRQFSFRNLEKAIAGNLAMKEQNIQPGHLSKNQLETIGTMLERSNSQKTSLLEELMRPEQTDEYLPFELRRKKRKLKR
ncbi:MAG: relaxase/mobilization nuclease domain-containing protein [Flavobacterium sp.]|uniref:relaxase/mobilization nuclease domain-containing protein n=1 Tax=Flavobacterium sp. TaxID=239 RepID=UPI0032663D0F